MPFAIPRNGSVRRACGCMGHSAYCQGLEVVQPCSRYVQDEWICGVLVSSVAAKLVNMAVTFLLFYSSSHPLPALHAQLDIDTHHASSIVPNPELDFRPARHQPKARSGIVKSHTIIPIACCRSCKVLYSIQHRIKVHFRQIFAAPLPLPSPLFIVFGWNACPIDSIHTTHLAIFDGSTTILIVLLHYGFSCI